VTTTHDSPHGSRESELAWADPVIGLIYIPLWDGKPVIDFYVGEVSHDPTSNSGTPTEVPRRDCTI
jgi:hypothetical protein